MSNFKLEFTLKQHTPIIHFQSDQKGATLRATELKPKLDRFLIEQLKLIQKNNKNVVIPKDEYKSWFVAGGKEHLALDYKVKIQPNNSTPNNNSDLKSPLYFAGRRPNFRNPQEEVEFELARKKFKINKKKFTITFIVFNIELKNKIEKYFSSFIFQTAFGSRQSKGFGSFVVLDDKLLEKLKKMKFTSNLKACTLRDFHYQWIKFRKKSSEIEILPTNLYKFTANSQDDAFSKINYFYKMLRGGINEYRKDISSNQVSIFYGKSLLWLFAMKEKDWTWDKKAIKKHFFNYNIELDITKHNSPDIMTFSGDNEYLLRDLLGLSTEQSWYSYNRSTLVKQDKIKDNKKNPIIERFKSPICFKPIKTKEGFDIYYWAEEIPSAMLSRTFEIIVNKDNKNIKELSTPSNFNIDDYLRFIHTFSKENKISSHIDEKFHNDPPCNLSMPTHYKSTNIYDMLQEVFSTIEEVK